MQSNLGTFRGFNTKTGEHLAEPLSADQVIAWDHYARGMTEFYPVGDRHEMVSLFGANGNIQGRLLLKLDELLQGMGGDHLFNFLLLHFVLNGLGKRWDTLSQAEVYDLTIDVEFHLGRRRSVREQFFLFEREFDIEFRRG